jgi:hypothetical protein
MCAILERCLPPKFVLKSEGKYMERLQWQFELRIYGKADYRLANQAVQLPGIPLLEVRGETCIRISLKSIKIK